VAAPAAAAARAAAAGGAATAGGLARARARARPAVAAAGTAAAGGHTTEGGAERMAGSRGATHSCVVSGWAAQHVQGCGGGVSRRLQHCCRRLCRASPERNVFSSATGLNCN
jgi:hypothetical protein